MATTLTIILPIVTAIIGAFANAIFSNNDLGVQSWFFNRVDKCPYFKELHHVSLSISDLKAAKEFYGEFLKLTRLQRPDVFPFKGLWYALPNGKQLHLVENPIDAERNICPDKKYEKYAPDIKAKLEKSKKELFEVINGQLVINRHFAIRAKTLEYLQQLETKAIGRGIVCHLGYYDGLKQMYLLDPDGNMVEINYFKSSALKSTPFRTE